jgi:hypothetical protein
MTTGRTGTDRRQDTVTDAAGNACWRMRQAVIQIAEAAGAELREQPMVPGSIWAERYAVPLAGIQAAEVWPIPPLR